MYHREGTAWATHVPPGIRYGCREMAAITWIPHSLRPGTPGGVSASAAGSRTRLLRQAGEMLQLEEGHPRDASKEGQRERAQGPRDQLGGCGGSLRREPEMTQEMVERGEK